MVALLHIVALLAAPSAQADISFRPDFVGVDFEGTYLRSETTCKVELEVLNEQTGSIESREYTFASLDDYWESKDGKLNYFLSTDAESSCINQGMELVEKPDAQTKIVEVKGSDSCVNFNSSRSEFERTETSFHSKSIYKVYSPTTSRLISREVDGKAVQTAFLKTTEKLDDKVTTTVRLYTDLSGIQDNRGQVVSKKSTCLEKILHTREIRGYITEHSPGPPGS